MHNAIQFLSFSSTVLTLLVGQQEGHLACRKLGLLVVTIWLELCTSYSSICHTTSIFLSLRDILLVANPGPPGKWPLKRRVSSGYAALKAADLTS